MNNKFRVLYHIIKNETVLFISLTAAILTMFFVPPTAAYISYLNLRVLALLFCLMAVVAGFQKTGLFLLMADKLFQRATTVRSLSFILILLCFFSSMWITNDVALITFVPFAIMVLTIAKQRNYIIRIIVLQTIAANLGSMLTPIGNPQNLYLYMKYDISIINFLKITFPYTAVSFVLLFICILLIKKEPLASVMTSKSEADALKTSLIILYGLLFIISLACVLRLLDYRITFILVLSVIFLFDRSILKRIDYCLLLTFICFFIFVGNIGQIEVIKDFLAELITGRELFVAILSSQIISNVPAAALLSAFTSQYKAILLGTDIGGLGTLIASLASLISYKFYCRTEDAKPGRYLLLFTGYNLAFLFVLCILCFISNLL